MALLERTGVTSSNTDAAGRDTRRCDTSLCLGDVVSRLPDRVLSMRDGKLDSAALFEAGPTVQILHLGQVYVLRLTSNNKLILTK